jgi:hypothetical protein
MNYYYEFTTLFAFPSNYSIGFQLSIVEKWQQPRPVLQFFQHFRQTEERQ